MGESGVLYRADMKLVRRLVLRMIARRRMFPLEVHGVLLQVGCECCVRSVYNVLRRLERDGRAASEKVRTGRAGNLRRYYWAVRWVGAGGGAKGTA